MVRRVTITFLFFEHVRVSWRFKGPMKWTYAQHKHVKIFACKTTNIYGHLMTPSYFALCIGLLSADGVYVVFGYLIRYSVGIGLNFCHCPLTFAKPKNYFVSAITATCQCHVKDERETIWQWTTCFFVFCVFFVSSNFPQGISILERFTCQC